ncbi:hypothetical protein ccbrp13_56530 [Ktedonobacteria bacterium brp13]|nr:hypothetical protein ccbrp13_56530 [Ktedonobacteria bacterium brp13]
MKNLKNIFNRFIQAANEEEAKEERYESLEARIDDGQELTQEEIEESVRLFYELHPELVDWK